MRSICLAICVMALLASLSVAGGDAGVRLLSERNGELEVEVSPEALASPFVPAAHFFVAIPAGATVRVERIGGTATARPLTQDERDLVARRAKPDAALEPLPAGLVPADPVRVSEPFTFRGVRIVGVACYLRQVDVSAGQAFDWTPYRVVVRYPAGAAVKPAALADPLVASLVVNSEVFPQAAPPSGAGRVTAQGGLDPGFSLGSGWIKIEVEARGVYALTYAALVNANIPVSAIGDPATFRMFAGSGLDQEYRLDDPEASWRLGNWMREIAIEVEDAGTEHVFGPGDRVIFYALGPEGWREYYDPASADTLYHVHHRAKRNVYYLTWEGGFSGQPLRMTPAAAAPTPDAERTTYHERMYSEKNLVSNYDYRGDGWLWVEVPRTGVSSVVLEDIQISGLVASVPQVFRTVALAPYDARVREIIYDTGGHPIDTVYVNQGHHAVYKARNGGITRLIGEYVWNSASSDNTFESGKPVRLQGDFLRDGTNRITLEIPRDLNARDWMYFAWYAISYERRLEAIADRLAFSSPDTTGTVNFRVSGLSSGGGTVHVFDVTDPYVVERLTGGVVEADGAVTRRVRFSSAIGGARRHFWVATGALPPPMSVRWHRPTDLRAAVSGPRMLVVAPSTFQSAARLFADHRSSRMPHYGSGEVRTVTTDDVYDNFSGGLPDPMAIRNYVKFLYENYRDGENNPILSYLLLLGDANQDAKNFASQQIDYVPTNIRFDTPSLETFTTDEWFGHMDLSDQTPGYGALDVAVGRLPAGSSAEALLLVEKVIGYETAAPLSDWRNRVVLSADNEGSQSENCSFRVFTDESEFIAALHVPKYIDLCKIYLTEYKQAGSRHGSHYALLEEWNEGVVAINYIGHGSSQQMADELLFLDSDVGMLRNGFKLPLLMGFSCTIGDFANSIEKCLSEMVLLKEDGGVIGAVTASALSYVFPNEYLNVAMFRNMLPRKPGPGVPIGEAIAAAKLTSLIERDHAWSQEDNNWKYNLMADPSLSLVVPSAEIRLIPAAQDTMVAGIRKVLRCGVYRNGELDAGFSGDVSVTVREPRLLRDHVTPCETVFQYWLLGGEIYRGTARVTDGIFELSFRVPRYARTGPRAYITAYAVRATDDAGGTYDSLLTVVAPTPADSLLLRPIDGGPRVRFGFKSGLTVVKPGESLQATVRDQDGINILNTTTQGRHMIVVDDAPVATDVTESFAFDQPGVDTSGVLDYQLPSLPVGPHEAIYRVSDSFGQTTTDTLQFTVTDPLDYFAEVVLNYPNPFRTTTQFMVRLSDRASIRLDVFTVSGKRIRRLEVVRDGGEQWIPWDGRDESGDEIANGVYLYVARIDFYDIDRPPLILRGNVVKIE